MKKRFPINNASGDDGERESERMPFTSLVIHELLAAKLITLDEFSHKKF